MKGVFKMTYEIVIALVSNIVVLMSLSVIYSLFTNETRLSQLSSKLVMGISVSLVGYIVMANAVEMQPGIIFDGRSVLMILTGLYFGLIPTIIGTIVLSLYRISIGGNGAVAGVLWVVLPSIFGLVWRWIRFKNQTINKNNITKLEQYLVLLLNQIVVVAILFLFPNKIPMDVINAVSIPLIIAYPIAGFLVSLFMLQQRHNYFRAVQIKDREKEYSNLFNKGSSYGFLLDPITKQIKKVNQVAIERYGYNEEEFLNLTFYDVNFLKKENLDNLVQNAEKKGLDFYITKHILKDREIIDVEVRVTEIEIDTVSYLYATVTDISKRLENEEKYLDVNTRLEATLHSVSEGVISVNAYGEIEIINDFATSFLNLDKQKKYETILDVVHIRSDQDQKTFEEIYQAVRLSKDPYISEHPYILESKNRESVKYIDFSLSPITYQDEVLRGMIFVFRDVTGEFIAKKKIKYVSQHDFLTGLYNRYFLEAEMKRLDTVRQLPISIIHGDVNGLKLVNDVFGHFEGDKLIKEIASILSKAIRSEDIIARWGGDEFIILLPQTSKENAQKVIHRIRDLQQKSMYRIMTPSISIGLSTKETENDDLLTILAEAENMMYMNKQDEGTKMRKEFLHYIKDELQNIHPELGQHCLSVKKIAEDFGAYLSLEKADIRRLSLLGEYHDIGWIGINKNLLLKTEPLLKQELSVVKGHPDIGFRILKSIPELAGIAEMVRCHHEWYDGCGYPSGLQTSEIPYLSRIISIIDAFDQMTNISIYREKKSIQAALEELAHCAGTQFDPAIVDQFIIFIKEKGLK
jgi:diguanylate cyclase (GGDEF)-like protein/PAS domain S-box-containing protein